MADRAGFLYPFLDPESEDPKALLADLASSATAKWAESRELRRTTLAALDDVLRDAARAVASRLNQGGRLFAFGNGGSATDAEAFVEACATCAVPLPARSLASDAAVVTALANDIGVDAVFARQLAATARSGDIAVGFSTSGGSTNVIAALDQARRDGLLTIAIVGYGGGALRDRVDYCLGVASDSVHRIQESQAAVAATLVAMISSELRTRRLT